MTGKQPILVGLTGSIGMGKSTTAAMFQDAGVPVWDADSAVHRIYASGGGGADVLAEIAPSAIDGDRVDRSRLKDLIRKDSSKLTDVEAVIHPLVAKDRQSFISSITGPVAVLDIPLLFETGSEEQFDHVVVVSAPSDVQRARVMARPGMTEDLFQTILSKQTPDGEKRSRADWVFDTSMGLEKTRDDVRLFLKEIGANADERDRT